MAKHKGSVLVPSTTRGRFALEDAVSGRDLTSGDRVALLIGGTWVSGTVEHSRVVVRPGYFARGVYTSQEIKQALPLVGGYYVVADDGSVCGLCTGMVVRVL